MEKTIVKPNFEEITMMNLPDIGITFNSQRVGPKNFYGLRRANYGKGFRMPTMPEIVPLVYASLENQKYETAENVIKTLEIYWITGDTAIHYFPEGIFAEDVPKMENGRIVTPTFKILEKRLGSNEERRVVFSDDRSVRFVPYGFKKESQDAFNLERNPGVIALVGGEKNAEKLAKASGPYKLNPYFCALNRVESPQTRVAGLGSIGLNEGLDVDASFSKNNDRVCSFGVLK